MPRPIFFWRERKWVTMVWTPKATDATFENGGFKDVAIYEYSQTHFLLAPRSRLRLRPRQPLGSDVT
eukprot:COSAG04_NODE_552_length_12696_cov_3.047154_3_plen_67_part_00